MDRLVFVPRDFLQDDISFLVEVDRSSTGLVSSERTSIAQFVFSLKTRAQ